MDLAAQEYHKSIDDLVGESQGCQVFFRILNKACPHKILVSGIEFESDDRIKVLSIHVDIHYAVNCTIIVKFPSTIKIDYSSNHYGGILYKMFSMGDPGLIEKMKVAFGEIQAFGGEMHANFIAELE